MPAVTIRNLSEETHRALKVRAAQHSRSTEAEIRAKIAHLAADDLDPCLKILARVKQIHTFTREEGLPVFARMALGADGRLYGTSSWDGPAGGGAAAGAFCKRAVPLDRASIRRHSGDRQRGQPPRNTRGAADTRAGARGAQHAGAVPVVQQPPREHLHRR